MLVNQAVQLAVLTVAAVLWVSRTDAATPKFKLCGRKLSEMMSKICDVYNSPSWDVPTVVEQPVALARRRRQVDGGIADECCTYGCSFQQFTEYCSSTVADSTLDSYAHLIENRSAESGAGAVPAVAAPTVLSRGSARGGAGGRRREVGRRNGGYARARRCRCRRKRRSGRRRASLMGNMVLLKSAARAAPVVGTVSPLLTWGRTLNTDLPPGERDRYAYVAVYST